MTKIIDLDERIAALETADPVTEKVRAELVDLYAERVLRRRRTAVRESVTENGLCVGALLRGWVKLSDAHYRHPIVAVEVRATVAEYVISYPADHVDSGVAQVRLPLGAPYGTVVDVVRALALLAEARG